ncbi:MAG: tRNA pseudouridine(38-40) synthase TruA [Chlorobiaceae bacterium]
MKNILINVEYDGTSFAGWQRQPGGILTVQGELEAALHRILQESITLAASGRTDSGVHARAQTVTFTTASSMELSRMVHSLNCLLPQTVRVFDPIEVPSGFHARFSAKERQYRYFLLEEPSAIYGRFAGCSNAKLDLDVMKEFALEVIGIHDFSAFAREDRDSAGSICDVRSCSWRRQGRFLVFRIAANRFLRSMVRYLVNAMIRGGKGDLSKSDFTAMLNSSKLDSSLSPASASGLFLWEVTY